MDEGDILLMASTPIGPDETAPVVSRRLSTMGAQLMIQTLTSIADGTAIAIPQDHVAATYAPKLRKAEGLFDWTLSAADIYNRFRGFNPWPGCFFGIPGKKGGVLRLVDCAIDDRDGQAGKILESNENGLLVATGCGSLWLKTVQPSGGKAMSGADFARGRRLSVGDSLSVADEPSSTTADHG